MVAGGTTRDKCPKVKCCMAGDCADGIVLARGIQYLLMASFYAKRRNIIPDMTLYYSEF